MVDCLALPFQGEWGWVFESGRYPPREAGGPLQVGVAALSAEAGAVGGMHVVAQGGAAQVPGGGIRDLCFAASGVQSGPEIALNVVGKHPPTGEHPPGLLLQRL